MESDKRPGYGNPPDETKFLPGQSGNPGGRPPSYITNWLRELGDSTELEVTVRLTKNGTRGEAATSVLSTDGKQTIFQFIAAKLLQMGMQGDMKAIKEILNRTEGRVAQPVNIGGQSDNPMSVVLMVPENGRMDPITPDKPTE